MKDVAFYRFQAVDGLHARLKPLTNKLQGGCCRYSQKFPQLLTGLNVRFMCCMHVLGSWLLTKFSGMLHRNCHKSSPSHANCDEIWMVQRFHDFLTGIPSRFTSTIAKFAVALRFWPSLHEALSGTYAAPVTSSRQKQSSSIRSSMLASLSFFSTVLTWSSRWQQVRPLYCKGKAKMSAAQAYLRRLQHAPPRWK